LLSIDLLILPDTRSLIEIDGQNMGLYQRFVDKVSVFDDIQLGLDSYNLE